MCTRKLSVKNPSKSLKSSDKTFLEVSCGHCPECLASKHMSWCTRLYYEWQHTKKHGGTAFYFTLTYNDEHLPMKYGIPVFDKRDCQLFFKLLGTHLQRTYGKRLKFTRFLTSEYGHEHQRPHYHFIIFTKFPITEFDMLLQVERAWVDSEGKSRGFVASGSLGAVVESIAALNYVAKYITKDMEFEEFYEELRRKYILFNPPLTTDNEADLSYYYDKVEEDLKQFKPFVLSSHHLGESILDEMETRKSSLEASRLLIPDTEVQGQYKEVPVPLYIKRKIYYNQSCPVAGKRVEFDEHGKRVEKYSVSYVLNEAGIRSKVNNLDRDIDERTSVLESYLSYNDTKESYQLLGSTVADVRNLINSMLDGRSLRSLAIYELVYKGHRDVGVTDYKSDYEFFIDPLPLTQRERKDTLYNHRKEYEDFDDVLDIFDKFKKLESYNSTKKRIDKYNSVQIVQSQLNPYKYRKARLIPDIPLKSF